MAARVGILWSLIVARSAGAGFVPVGDVNAPAAENAFLVGGERFPGGAGSDLVATDGMPAAAERVPVAVDFDPFDADELLQRPDRDL